ncbi:hypothetical protein D3C80_1394830 [compost metagenome]
MLRRRCGAASLARAIRIGKAAPNPNPVIRRAISSVVYVSAWAVPSEKPPNNSTATIRMALRPSRSASHPPINAPGSSPSSPALNTQPSMAGVSANSLAMCGAATPVA